MGDCLLMVLSCEVVGRCVELAEEYDVFLSVLNLCLVYIVASHVGCVLTNGTAAVGRE